MDLRDVLTILPLVGSILTAVYQLSLKNLIAQHREELRTWIEERYLLAREADGRMRRIEDDHRELSATVNENERRLRIVEQVRGAAR